ncbi:MAG: YabP/YqfC family sporulation protein [Ruminococcus sp.]|nr:YabP/YqfC family sporulation protein [Ruminococcus sp.]
MDKRKTKDLALKAVGETSYISVYSNTRAVVEGSTQILECNEILVRVRTRQFIVEISGTDLKVNCFNNGSVSICGTVSGISLDEPGGK